MLTDDQIQLVRTSYKTITAVNPQIVSTFYARLFSLAPDVRPMFSDDIEAQADKLRMTLQVALSSLNNPTTLIPVLHHLGQTHHQLGVTRDQYQLVAEVMIDTLADEAGDAWTPEISAAWAALLAFVAETMQTGAAAE